MGTILSFHAHPDDEAIGSGGTLARASAAGHRVVLVFATRGELGEPVDGVLSEGEQLAMRRTAEVFTSAEVLGVHRVEFLGWTDSGMIGEATNDAPWCFWQADVEHAARRLAAILEEESPDIITIYDDNGGYGHPDHIQVHRVGKRAAELASVPVVAQGTMNRDHLERAFALGRELGLELPDRGDPDGPPPELGLTEDQLTHTVDGSAFIDQKRASMLAHESQISPDHFMAAMPREAFDFVFGREFFLIDHPLDDAPDLFHELFEPIHDA